MNDYYKICLRCGRKKKKDKHFHRNPNGKDGFRNICKSCMGTKSFRFKLLSDDLLSFLAFHPHSEVNYFGFKIGYIITIRKGEFMAYSILKGSRIFEEKQNAKAWLCHRVIKAAKVIERGLTRRLKDYEN